MQLKILDWGQNWRNLVTPSLNLKPLFTGFSNFVYGWKGVHLVAGVLKLLFQSQSVVVVVFRLSKHLVHKFSLSYLLVFIGVDETFLSWATADLSLVLQTVVRFRPFSGLFRSFSRLLLSVSRPIKLFLWKIEIIIWELFRALPFLPVSIFILNSAKVS